MVYAGLSLLIFFGLAIYIWINYLKNNEKILQVTLPAMLFLTTLHYTLFSSIQKGMFYRSFSFVYSDTLYIFIVAIMFFMWFFMIRKETDLPGENGIVETNKRWTFIIIGFLIGLILLALISVNIHDGLPGSHDRF